MAATRTCPLAAASIRCILVFIFSYAGVWKGGGVIEYCNIDQAEEDGGLQKQFRTTEKYISIKE